MKTTKQLKMKARIEELERKLRESEATQVHRAHFTLPILKKLGRANMLGGAVIIEISTLGGKIKIPPFSIVDGFSSETLQALEKDIIRTYEHAVAYSPTGLKELPDFE